MKQSVFYRQIVPYLEIGYYRYGFHVVIIIFNITLHRFILGRYKHALDALKRAESLLTRPDTDIFYLLGDLLLRKAEMSESYNNSSQAGTSTDLKSKYLTEAKKYFILSVEHDGRQVESFRKLSNVYMQESQISKAIDMLESCIRYVLYIALTH